MKNKKEENDRSLRNWLKKKKQEPERDNNYYDFAQGGKPVKMTDENGETYYLPPNFAKKEKGN